MTVSSDQQSQQPPPLKRPRTEEDENAVVEYSNNATTTTTTTSNLLNHPTMQLTGHDGSIYCLSYDVKGETLASGSFDMKVLLWNVSSSGCENYNVLQGHHKNAILDLKWMKEDSSILMTASADKSIIVWDTMSGQRIKKCLGHAGIVNSLDPFDGSHTFVTASDDCTCRLWDTRVSRGGQISILQHDYPMTSVAASYDQYQIFTGGIDNGIHCWDIRKVTSGKESSGEPHRVYTMKGHTDTITYLSLHPKGTHLLSNSMDQSVRSWDIRPYVEGQRRHYKTFVGATHNAEKALLKCSWSHDGQMVSAGSADRMVHIWDEFSTEELYLLPGHKGTVHTTIFHPLYSQQIASSSSDKTIFVGELG